ncbi:pyridoxamine 5'-phosphate oxidase family protein [Gordonia sp. HY002]|uniref:pyridoxamine 5'-phosphate oxidase family protein n=2 Tax=Gordonia zhenghanii TaxID=2911516 RepID=UPI001F44C2CD|nr:pyridoxamine 5'-phosphate oxidase family protein [Gordonia zhenghanii]MCF8571837.1 pyridoxamine 5'-phosphate oxidase family protein [Gordonia zhenghanii]
MATEPENLRTLTRKPDRGGDRDLLDEVLDEALVGTVSTVVEGWPWSVPMVLARLGDDVIVHGSTGAGLLRHVAEGAAVTVTAYVLDGLVVSNTMFDHSANYRAVVVRGILEPVDDEAAALAALTDSIVPGRSSETPLITAKEIAATRTLRLPIVDGQWTAKARSGGAGVDTDEWTGVIPVSTVYGEPLADIGGTMPASVRRLVDEQ